MLLGLMGVSRLPHSSTFCRFMKSAGINQARGAGSDHGRALGTGVAYSGDRPEKDIDIDTTVETNYGQI